MPDENYPASWRALVASMTGPNAGATYYAHAMQQAEDASIRARILEAERRADRAVASLAEEQVRTYSSAEGSTREGRAILERAMVQARNRRLVDTILEEERIRLHSTPEGRDAADAVQHRNNLAYLRFLSRAIILERTS